ncbi:hypothetical protein M422DRAFT_107206, partial [Sphaerobolus stellatus SS14]
EIHPHEKLYYVDGDIILLSLPVKAIITAFKVDKVLLKRASPVFEGMFALPPVEDVEKYDGVPASGNLQFLCALYDTGTIPFKKLQPDTIRRVEGTLILATKYQSDSLRNRIIALLEADWPSTLTGWDTREAEMRREIELCGHKWEEHLSNAEEIWPEPASCIRLANLCGVPSILPAAFYDLCRIPFDAD